MELSIQTPRWSVPLIQGQNGSPRYRAAKGGRGSGKSHFFAEKAVERMVEDPNTSIICIREIQKSLKFSAKKLIEEKIDKLGVGHLFEIQTTEIKSRLGAGIIIFQGMQDHTADSVKSLEGFDIAWVEEASSMSARSLELLDPTIRKDGSEIWFSWNPYRPTDPIEQFMAENPAPESVLVHCTYKDNPFASDSVVAMAERMRKANPIRYNHVWMGDHLSEIEGALFTVDMIRPHRIEADALPDLNRIVVAVDPAVTGGANSDESGIIVAGRGAHDGRFYVLDDASMRGTPDQWIRRTIARYHEHKADRVVAEVNNGGDMIENLIRNTDRSVSYKAVRATRGKILRAEPIAALYESGKVSHVGTFQELEEQMIFYNGSGGVSPDRLDALVWALTELSQGTGTPVWRIG